MIEFIAQNWLVVAIALLIGLITAWWVWHKPASQRDDAEDSTHGINAKTDWLPEDGHSVPNDDGSTEAGTVAAAPLVAPQPDLRAKPEPEIRPEPAPAMQPRRPEPVAAPASPAPEGKPKIAAAVGRPDDLRKIKGVGPKLNTLLGDLGVARFDQIAVWGAAEIAEVDGYLGNFKGRIERDNWVDQAGFLAGNDIAGFEAKYGKL